MNQLKVLVAHLGARKHYQEPVLLHRWNLLHKFYTDYYAGDRLIYKVLKGTLLFDYLPATLKKGLERCDEALNTAQVKDFPILGLRFAVARRWIKAGPARTKLFLKTAKSFCDSILSAGIEEADVIYGLNGASLELFEKAKKQGKYCILDQVIAERSLLNKLLAEEEQRWPNWSLTSFSISKEDLELEQREQQEQDLADHIVCGSEFVKETLVARNVDKDKISVVPLGLGIQQSKNDELQPKISPEKGVSRDQSINILFVGKVNLRKGIPYLLNALKSLKGKVDFNCKVLGKIEISETIVEEYKDVCDFLGLVPRSKVFSLYEWADVFVLPSLCEGSAMVTYEAMKFGLPIITTKNTGSVIRDGIEGYIVPIRSSSHIADKIEELSRNRAQYSCNKNAEYLSSVNQQALVEFKSIFFNI